MTIKQMAKKYDLDYQLVYHALLFSGFLIRGKKDAEYNEKDMIQACVSYICVRLDKIKVKAWNLIDALERINSMIKNEG